MLDRRAFEADFLDAIYAMHSPAYDADFVRSIADPPSVPAQAEHCEVAGCRAWAEPGAALDSLCPSHGEEMNRYVFCRTLWATFEAIEEWRELQAGASHDEVRAGRQPRRARAYQVAKTALAARGLTPRGERIAERVEGRARRGRTTR
jgi:hypothetical protein